MKNYIKILSLLIFIVSLWTVSSFFQDIVNRDVSKLKDLNKEFLLKESFSKQSSPSNLSKSISEFIPEKFDKSKLTDLIIKYTQESGVSIKNIDIKTAKKSSSYQENNLLDDLETDSQNIKNNTLNLIDLEFSFNGDKQSVDSLLDKMLKSKQYIDIKSINFNYKNFANLNSNEVEGTIIATLYYINL
jgi:uncharacterized protein YxeA